MPTLETYSKDELIGRVLHLESRLKEYEHVNVFSTVYEAAFYVVKREWPSVTDKTLKSKSRLSELVAPRHMMMFLLCTVGGVKLGAVGRFFGGRDHSSVIHARDKVLDISSYDKRERERMVRCVKMMKTLLLSNGL